MSLSSNTGETVACGGATGHHAAVHASPKRPFLARVAGRGGATARALYERVAGLRHRLRLRRLRAGRDAEYQAYLDEQLSRTLGKRHNDPGVGARLLVEAAATSAKPHASVLCVGCRNGFELDEFRARGLSDVIGIDIFSQRDDILVMDMHRMSFDSDTFDVVYSSHSLEHAHDPARVVAEVSRVAREGAVVAVEVPVRHRGSDADRVEFADLSQLEALFAGRIGDVVLAEELEARGPRNDQGSAVARLVFRLRKPV
jgi:SAM-dependent methyltransferase